jgi:hypothetical protein
MWTLGLLPNEDLPLAGVRALEAGIDTEASRILAGLEAYEHDKAPELFKELLEGFPPLLIDEAAKRYAVLVAKAILSREIEPYIGARAIWDAANRVKRTREFRELDGFIYAASEYQERPRDRVFLPARSKAKRDDLLPASRRIPIGWIIGSRVSRRVSVIDR